MANICKYIYWNEDKARSFKDHMLILPDISIGNVGQLTVDLLLNNLKVEHLGRIAHPCFVPFIGRDPFNPESNRLESSCEIYENKEKKLVIIQIRSYVFRSKYSEFEDLILNFIKNFNFKRTTIITSSSSEYFPAEQLRSVPLHYLSTSKFPNKEDLKQLNWKEFSLPHSVVSEAHEVFIPGSFVSYGLLEKCEKENLSLISLICICSEGNNYPEALHLISCINSWLNLKVVKDSEKLWAIPTSWKLPYGNAPPVGLY